MTLFTMGTNLGTILSGFVRNMQANSRTKKARFYTGFQQVSGTFRNAPEALLLSNTESPKYLSKQIISTELAGNRA